MIIILGLSKESYFDIEERERECNIHIIQDEHWNKHFSTCTVILANRVRVASDPIDDGCSGITIYYENFNNPIVKLKPPEFIKIEIK